jgi:hypothetical protein
MVSLDTWDPALGNVALAVLMNEALEPLLYHCRAGELPARIDVLLVPGGSGVRATDAARLRALGCGSRSDRDDRDDRDDRLYGSPI